MSEPRWLITNALLVSDGRSFHADLRVRDGRIVRIERSLTATDDETVVDASGLWLLPGMIDSQVHFREPGLTHKGDLTSESRAAIAGGITSYMEMPNTRPPAVTIETLEAKYTRAAEVSAANYGFYLGATNDNLGEIRKLDPTRVPGLKVFMGASTGNMLVDNPETLDAIFREAPCTLITHCEDTPIIDANVAEARLRYGDDIPVELHPELRSREACIKSTRLAIELAQRHGSSLHVLHISSADELALFEPGPIEHKRITAETCVHFLHFDSRDYLRRGNFIKCNPAIKHAADREAIVRALAEGRLDVLATDHAPHTLKEKSQHYAAAPSGLPLVQHALQCALERVFDGDFPITTLVERFAHAAAKRYRIQDRGFLREGGFADLVLVDPNRVQQVRREDTLSRCGWSPFEGETFRSSIHSTFVNGRRVWHNGGFDQTPRAMRLEFASA
ncbi:MAG TPA: dihydroorotase [Pseudomonadota bacterium]|nr:dihydroorotase [Rhodanobacteraceae bacterium]MBP9153639.1 dihydroorotase [Xanthomonadales bacterium]HQW80655.1 dihydroorotase [Pseudomonadota bacterium]